jgi:hypothetical protein
MERYEVFGADSRLFAEYFQCEGGIHTEGEAERETYPSGGVTDAALAARNARIIRERPARRALLKRYLNAQRWMQANFGTLRHWDAMLTVVEQQIKVFRQEP